LKKALFILSGNLSTTPRAVKLIQLFAESHHCTVLYIDRSSVWQAEDKKISFPKNVKLIAISLGRKPFLPWFTATMYQICSRVLFNFYKRSIKLNAFASDKSSIKLVCSFKKIENDKFDIIMGHSYGAMYPAYFFSKKYNVPFVFDIEDYHPGETILKDSVNEQYRREFLMKSILPNAIALTYASKLIGDYSLALIKTYPKHVLVLNSFESSDFKMPIKKEDNTIKCVWFSQTIGPNRGLEQLFEASTIHTEIEFHIIGNANNDYLKTIEMNSNIKLHSIMSQTQLHQFLSTIDIGLALETSNADFNRNICLTNKILAYAQAGLYVLATDTLGQRDFLTALNYNAGELITLNLSATLSNFGNSVLNYENKVQRWEHAKSFSWEKEQQKLVKLLKSNN
jgi:glycosyltransferase involved in cell wall biosynthesis